MKTHIVTLEFHYEEDEYPQVTDRESAIQQAIEEINHCIVAVDFSFDYEVNQESKGEK